MASLRIFTILLFTCLCVGVFSANLQRLRRSNEDTTTKTGGEICLKSTPCSWLVYTRFTREPETLVKNACTCPKGYTCERTDDDISISAYVYRCKIPKKESDTNSTRNES